MIKRETSNTTAGTSGASPDKHQTDHDRLGKLLPTD